MTVQVRYFGRLRELAGREVRQVALSGDGATVGALMERVREEDFGDAGSLDGTVAVVGDEAVGGDRALEDGETVDLLPPVSGG